MTSLEPSIEAAWKLPVVGSCQNCAGKFAESAQSALKDTEFEDMISINDAAAISNYHDSEYGFNVPRFYQSPTESPLTVEWDMEILDELDANSQHQAGGDFMELPEGRKALPPHWVYNIKYNEVGNVQWFKARLLFGKTHQIKCTNNQATYAPTGPICHVGLALAIASKYNLDIHQLDVCAAFLRVDLDEVIYMHPL
jgi:hypothetical protein